MDFAHIEELDNLYEQLCNINTCLSAALEEEAKARIEFFKACSNCGAMEKLSEQSRLIVLHSKGFGAVADRLVEAEKEVTKCKAGFKVAEHAINIKKHEGRVQP